METLLAISMISAALIICVGAISTAFGFAKLGSQFLESAARQPEVVPILQGKLFILAGLLDAVPMIGVAVTFIILFANPYIEIMRTAVGG